jgi:FAD/FMN-containing dehydrogenase
VGANDRGVISSSGRLVDEAAIASFERSLRGSLIRRNHPAYEATRRVWNHAFDKRPPLIVRCNRAEDVIRSVEFAGANDIAVAVRGGAHSFAGHSACDGGIVIDFSDMKNVRVDPQRRVVRVEAGAKIGELDRATQAFGLATPMGGCEDVGVAGLTLGGGQGLLSGRYGLACDNLLSAGVVTADGRLLTASAEQYSDLFWGVRGGAGNFGVVASMEFQLHPVGTVLGGMITFPIEQGRDVLRFCREYLSDPPDELTVVPAVVRMPNGPLVAIVACYCGDIRIGEEVLQPLRTCGSPLDDGIRPRSYAEFQATMEQYNPKEVAAYRKSNFTRILSDTVIDLIVESVQRARGSCFVGLFPYRGAVCRTDTDATAFPIREPGYDIWIDSYWLEPRDADTSIEWTDGLWLSIRPFATEMVYVNNLSDEGAERARAAYGRNYERLVALKNKYDPTNFFRLNQNIRPTV